MIFNSKLFILYSAILFSSISCNKHDVDHVTPVIEFSESLLPGGEYEMGDHFGFVDPSHPTDELPVHLVKVNSFYVATTETTNSQFLEFLNYEIKQGLIEVRNNIVYVVDGTEPLYYTNKYSSYYSIDFSNGSFSITDFRAQHPVVGVMWTGAISYCNWLSRMKGLEECYDLVAGNCDFAKKGYRLPTEAEWEYAARGGDKSQNYIYSGSDTPSLVAWYGISGNNQSISPVQPCGGKAANELGIYDMSGNVWEWVADWYDTYSSISQIDPKGLTDDEASDANVIDKVRRGGGWANTNETTLRVSYRATCAPKVASGSTGFRFAKDI